MGRVNTKIKLITITIICILLGSCSLYNSSLKCDDGETYAVSIRQGSVLYDFNGYTVGYLNENDKVVKFDKPKLCNYRR